MFLCDHLHKICLASELAEDDFWTSGRQFRLESMHCGGYYFYFENIFTDSKYFILQLVLNNSCSNVYQMEH